CATLRGTDRFGTRWCQERTRMKTWFSKLKISAALDVGPKPKAGSPRRANVSAELLGFEEDMAVLDSELKQSVPKHEAPRSLHGSIMRAVKGAERPAVGVRRELIILPWLSASAVAVLALLVVWYAAHGPARPAARDVQSFDAATIALEMGSQVAQAVPSAVVNPLADELARVNRDLDSTAQVLLGRLP